MIKARSRLESVERSKLIAKSYFKITAFILLGLLIRENCYCQNKYVQIAFIIDGKPVKLSKSFEVTFIKKDSVGILSYKPIISGDSFKTIAVLEDSSFIFVFKYEKYILAFTQSSGFYNDQNMRWEINLDKKPFTQFINAEDSLSTNFKNYDYLYNIVYDPKEYGLGFVSYYRIYNKKEFRRNMKNLLKL